MTTPRNSQYGIPIFCAFLLSISVFSKHAASQAQIPDRYYTAPPESLIDEMRQTPRPRTGMNLAQLSELDRAVLPRALACESIFHDDPKMQERVKAWPRNQQVGLANECRRIIADSNAMQEQLKRLRQAEQEQVKRDQQAQAARKAEDARKAEETRVAEQRAAFMARQPDFLLILNAGARQFEVTKSLEGQERHHAEGQAGRGRLRPIERSVIEHSDRSIRKAVARSHRRVEGQRDRTGQT